MAPVVHDEARTLCELLLAASEVADELRLHLIFGSVEYFDPFIGTNRHGFKASVGLVTSHVLSG